MIFPKAILLLSFACFCGSFSLECSTESIWKITPANTIQIQQCVSGYLVRECDSTGNWKDIVSQHCECDDVEDCYTTVYSNVILDYLPEQPTIIETNPQDMSMNSVIPSVLQFKFNVPMNMGSGKGFIQSNTGNYISLDLSKASCLKDTCTIPLPSLLNTDTIYEVSIESSAFISKYNMVLKNPISIVFKTGPTICNTQYVKGGLGDSALCTCFSENDSCQCNCGEVQVNRII